MHNTTLSKNYAETDCKKLTSPYCGCMIMLTKDEGEFSSPTTPRQDSSEKTVSNNQELSGTNFLDPLLKVPNTKILPDGANIPQEKSEWV